MILDRNQAEWLILVFFMALVGVVFQQIGTDLQEQGIASGDAFHNAAFYPRVVALMMIGVAFIRAVALAVEVRKAQPDLPQVKAGELFRPLQLLLLFGLYLSLLDVLGYHLLTAPFIAVVMVIAGDRKLLPTAAFSLAVAFLVAFLFEKYLKVVLPGGVFSLNIPW